MVMIPVHVWNTPPDSGWLPEARFTSHTGKYVILPSLAAVVVSRSESVSETVDLSL